MEGGQQSVGCLPDSTKQAENMHQVGNLGLLDYLSVAN